MKMLLLAFLLERISSVLIVAGHTTKR